MANKKNYNFGYYFLKIPFDNIKQTEYLLSIDSKLSIADVNIARFNEGH